MSFPKHRPLGVFFLIVGMLSAAAQNAGEGEAERPFVVVCPVDGMVEDGLTVLIDRAVEEAEGAEALIFEIDTPGGRVDSAIAITTAILEAPCKTIAFIQGQGAISAGALIAYACDEMIMTPGTSIGASAPVMMGGGDPSETMDKKARSFLRARYRALGEANGHSTLLGEAMVEPDIELRGYKDAQGNYIIFRPEENLAADKENSGLEEIAETVQRAVENEVTRTMRQILETETAKKVRRALGEEQLPEEVDAPPPPPEAITPETLEDGTELVSREGDLLTLTTEEALRYQLASVKLHTLDEVTAYAGAAGAYRLPIVATWSELLYRWLTSPMISSLLLLLGVGGLYMEIRTPGIGLPGIIGVTCLAIFFGSRVVIGLADWVDLLLVMLGVALILAEIFLIPGLTVAGLAGAFCLVFGIYLSLTRVTIPQYSWDYDRLYDAGLTVIIAVVLYGALGALAWRFLPSTPAGRWIVLAHAQNTEAGYTVQTSEQVQAAVGLCGVATSVLRPAGRGRFGDSTRDVVTRGEYISKGSPIEVIEAGGNRLVVAESTEEGPNEQA